MQSSYFQKSLTRIWTAVLLWLCCSVVLADEFRPEFIHKPIPAYPADMLATNLSGMVTVGLTLHSDGSVSGARIIKSSHPAFEKDAVAIVNQWRFKPWTVTADAPAERDALNLLIFVSGGVSF